MTGIAASAVLAFALNATTAGLAAAQETAPVLKELNELLAWACSSRPVLTLGPDGTLVRKDPSGATFTLRLADVAAIALETPDAEANVLLRCKDDKPCVAREESPGAQKSFGKLLVFSIYPADQGTRVERLLRDLRAAAAGK